MKKLISIFALSALVLSARAQSVIGTLTITGTPANGATISIQSQLFTWTNGQPFDATYILITNTTAGDVTNLFNVAGLIVPFQAVQLIPSNSVLTLKRGGGLTVAISTGWATYTQGTNGTTGKPLMWPASAVDSATRTSAETQVASDLAQYSTYAFPTNAAIVANLAVLGNNQVFGGTNNFTNSISGTVGNFTNGTWTNPQFTNGQNYGAPFRSPGSASGSEQFGVSAASSGVNAVAFGDSASAGGAAGTAIGNSANASTTQTTALGASTTASGAFGTALGSGATAGTGLRPTAIGVSSTATANQSSAFGYAANATLTDSTAIGQNSTTTQTNQIMLGKANGSVDIPGALEVGGGISNVVTFPSSVNIFNGVQVIPSLAITSLVNSNNADLITGTNTYVIVSGPTGPFYIAGIQAGLSGQLLQIENSTSQDMWFGNQSGVESTAANRILTAWSADRKFTNNPAVISLRYDGNVSRWKIIGVN